MSCNFPFRLSTHDFGRGISDVDWQTIEPLHIDAWRKLENRLNSSVIELDQCTYRPSFDLTPAIGELEHRYNVLRRLVEQQEANAADDFRFEILNILINVEVTGSKADEKEWTAKSIIELLLHESYLLMNISSPGSFNMHAGVLTELQPRRSIYGKEIIHDINLSGRLFEAALYERDRFPWLNVGLLSIDAVSSWVAEVAPRLQMIPDNPSGKSLMALLHLAKGDYGPPSIIWVFYALEAFFDCKPEENFRIMVERISTHLELSADARSSLRKALRELYDLRSAFVHGSLSVTHPLANDGFDVRAEDEIWRFVPTTDFGVALILCAIQASIRRGWRYPVFHERIVGAEIKGEE